MHKQWKNECECGVFHGFTFLYLQTVKKEHVSDIVVLAAIRIFSKLHTRLMSFSGFNIGKRRG